MSVCIYISGPPCSGKSTVSRAIKRLNRAIEHINGDDWWNLYPELPFQDRLAITNRHLLDALRRSTSDVIICEWVPCGSFASEMYEVSLQAGCRFLHVILTAEESVLKQRKRRRDGNEDLGPATQDVAKADVPYTVMRFRTDTGHITAIVDDICEWLRNESVS